METTLAVIVGNSDGEDRKGRQDQQGTQHVLNGIEMKAIIFSVIDCTTAFGLAYDRVIMKTQTRKTERLLRGLLMAYNKKTGKWEAKGGTKYNPQTQKWETWFLR